MSTTFSQSEYLSILTHAPAEAVKMLAEDVIPALGQIMVLNNRTGLVMIPFTDSAQGTVFHLGEVLVAEAHIRLPDETEGYGMVIGRDVAFAMAVAVLDAALSTNIMAGRIGEFLAEQKQAKQANDTELLRKVEATRVEMETF
jgi:alpha-D-ribose 1-methylphosphonate 5-triphosphate synthase subunit PhnG